MSAVTREPVSGITGNLFYQVAVIEVIKWAMDFSLRPGAASRATTTKLLV